VDQTSVGYREPADAGYPAGEGYAAGSSSAPAVTSLAAATAAIITARWGGRAGNDHDSAYHNGHSGHGVQFGSAGDGPTAANGAYPASGAHPANPAFPPDGDYSASGGQAGNGYPANGGHPGNGYPASGQPGNGGLTPPAGFDNPYRDPDSLPQRIRGSAVVAPPANGDMSGSMFEPARGPSLFEPAAPPAAPSMFESPPVPSVPPSVFDSRYTPSPYPPTEPGHAFPATEARRAEPGRTYGPAVEPGPFEPGPPYEPGAPYAPVVSGAPYPPVVSGPPYAPAVSGAPYAPVVSGAPYAPADPYAPAMPIPVPNPQPSEPVGPPVPAQRPASEPSDDFTSSIMSDIAFPAPFEPEPYEAYDPFEPGRATRRGAVDPLDTDTEPMLPQRVPAEPDVPELILPPNDPLRDPATALMAEPRQLSRIATFLRDDEGAVTGRRPDGFDLNAVLEAVRSVPDVSDAHLRWNANSGHTLRIEFKDGVDEGQVTRRVVQLLRESMGLTAEPSVGNEGLERTSGSRVRGTASVGAPTVGSAPRPHDDAGRPTHPLPPARRSDGSLADIPRAVLDHVQVTTLGHDATVEVRLAVARDGVRVDAQSIGHGRGPAVDAYLLRLAAQAAGDAIDRLLVDPRTGRSTARIFIEHAAVVPFGGCEVAVVVLLLVGGPSPAQLSGSSVVTGDPVQAVVRATLSAVNRRLESLLS
jgi:hypothetical protein